MEIQIIVETADYLVALKPPGMLSHPTKPAPELTLWDHLRRALAPDLVAPGRQISLINRLDRETSGLMLVALNQPAARALGLAMQARQIRKEYLALVRGWPTQDSWVVDAPLDAQRRHDPACRVQLRQIVHPLGYPAQTQFSVLRRFRVGDLELALVEARPHTGRLHQIRVHLAHSGFPVLGDKLYGPPPGEELYLEFIETGWTSRLESLLLRRHHALHSCALAWDPIPVHLPGPQRNLDEDAPDFWLPAAEYRVGAPEGWTICAL